MSEFRPILQRARDRVPTPELPLEGIYHRRDRQRRNQRLGAGLVAAAIALLGMGVAYRIGVSGEQPADQAPQPRQSLRTAIVGVDGGLRRQILGLPADAFGTQLSPDGRSVVFITQDAAFAPCDACDDGFPRLATLDVNGTNPRALVGRWWSMSTPSWSPDGTKIAFAAVDQGPNSDIFVVDADGSNVLRLTDDAAADSYPSWSPGGTQVIYDNAGPIPLDAADLSLTQEIYTVAATGGTPVRLTHDDVGEKQAVYSPDGTQIAVSRGSGGIWLMRADGSHPHRVQGIEGDLFSPRWSPDGTKIAYLTYLDDLRPAVLDPRSAGSAPRRSLPLLQLGIVDLTTGTVTTLGILTASDVNAASWLPSGDALLIDRFTTT